MQQILNWGQVNDTEWFYVSIYFIAYSIRNKLFYINFNVLVFQSG